MKIAVVKVPFANDIGRWGSARGPQSYIDHGLLEKLRSEGHTVLEPVTVTLPNSERTRDTVSNLGRIAARQADAVASALREPGTLVMLLEGDCTHAPGAAGGVAQVYGDCGVAWYDAHGDMNTMANTTSGLWGGMPYGVMMGFDLEDWRLNAGLKRPVPTEAAALFGASDLDQGELDALERYPIARLDAKDMTDESIERKVSAVLADRVSRVPAWYLHLDLDVAGPEEAPGGLTPAPHWPPRDKLVRAVAQSARDLNVVAFSLAAINPTGDVDGKAAHLGIDLAMTIVRVLEQKA